VASIGLYDQKTGTFQLWNADPTGTPDYQFTFGSGGSSLLPIVGDGDGIDTVGLYDQKTGEVLLTDSNTAPSKDADFVFNAPLKGKGIPLAGHWAGVASDTVGVFDPASSVFYLKDTNTSGKPDHGIAFGAPVKRKVIPLAGDWDGNGSTSIGLLDPKTGGLYLRDTMIAGPPEVLDTLPVLGPNGQAFAGRFNGLKHAAGGKKAASIGEAGAAVSSLELAVRRQESRSSEAGRGRIPAVSGAGGWESHRAVRLCSGSLPAGVRLRRIAYRLPPPAYRLPSLLRPPHAKHPHLRLHLVLHPPG
jgi:hypothetical protein